MHAGKSYNFNQRSAIRFEIDLVNFKSAEEGKKMREMRVEKSDVAPAGRSVDGETRDPEDQNHIKTDGPATKPAAGRLPARASRS